MHFAGKKEDLMIRIKKHKKILIIIVCILSVCWLTMFSTDYIRGSILKPPVFTYIIGGATADDGGSGTYQGLGYKIDVKMKLEPRRVAYVKIYMFGKEIATFYE